MDRLNDIWLKIERAREHLKRLDELILSYFASKPYHSFREYWPDSDREVRGIVITQEPPYQVSLIAGEIVQHLRSALDYLVYQIIAANAGPP